MYQSQITSKTQELTRATIKRLKKIKEKDFLSIRKRNRRNIIDSQVSIMDVPVNDDPLFYKSTDY